MMTDSSYSPYDQTRIQEIISKNTQQYDLKINVMIVGDHLSGKSTLIDVFTKKDIDNDSKPTIGYIDKQCGAKFNRRVY
jgi:GTPase SAR1 family protein